MNRFRNLHTKEKTTAASIPPYIRIALIPDSNSAPLDKNKRNNVINPSEYLIASFSTPTGMIGRQQWGTAPMHQPSSSRSASGSGRGISQIFSSLNIAR